jgi:hypothetical protein
MQTLCKHAFATIKEAAFSLWVRLQDLTQLELELCRVLEMAVEGDRRNRKKGIRLCKEDFMCAAATVRLV